MLLWVTPPSRSTSILGRTYAAHSGRLSLFINGELQSSYVAQPPGVLLGKRGVPLVVGRSAPGVPQQNFYGQIDELRVWSSARSMDQIARHYDRRVHGDEPGLLLYANAEAGLDVDVTANCIAKLHSVLRSDARVNRDENAPVRRPLDEEPRRAESHEV